MKVLFVSSGNTQYGISPIVKNQGESLTDAGCQIEYFTIKSKGVWGYLKAIPALRKRLKNDPIDIIHAHYSMSAFVATLAGAKPLVVSLMGSDVHEKKWYRLMIKISSLLFWRRIIVKSNSMKGLLGLKKVCVIPNGVNLSLFKPFDRSDACDKVGWTKTNRHILFAADHKRIEKNYNLAYTVIKSMQNESLELHSLGSITISEMPFYYNASDVVILTSLWEGSPNVIKEAMACNCPIVTTDVGDIRWVIGNTEGCYIASFQVEDFAHKLILALGFVEENKRTNGREQLIRLGLDSETIANKIKELYMEVIE